MPAPELRSDCLLSTFYGVLQRKKTNRHAPVVALLVEHHVAQSNDMALTVGTFAVGICLFGYAHHLGVARIP